MKRESPVRLIRLICLAFVCAGLILMVIGTLFVLRRVPEANRVYVPARIEKIKEYRDSDGDKSYDVYVSYQAEGQRYEGEIGVYRAGFRVGQTIKIYYEKGNPTRIETPGGRELTTAMLFIMGTVFFLIGGKCLLQYRLLRPRREYLAERGIRINAEYVETKLGVSINDRKTYYVLCRWYDHEKKKEYRFYSDLLYKNPRPALEQLKITSLPVYIKSNHPRKYYVDLSEIARI